MKKCRSSDTCRVNSLFKDNEDCQSQECITVPQTNPINYLGEQSLKNRISRLQKITIILMHQMEIQIKKKSQNLCVLRQKISKMMKEEGESIIDCKTLIQQYRNAGLYMIHKYLDADRVQSQIISQYYNFQLKEIKSLIEKEKQKRNCMHKSIKILLKQRKSSNKAFELYRNMNSYSETGLKKLQEWMLAIAAKCKQKLKKSKLRWEKNIEELHQQLNKVETLLIEDLRKQTHKRQNNQQKLLQIFESHCLELDPNIFQI